MISFFTSLKPFHGIAAVQQRNALRSWQTSNPGSEIIVFGSAEAGADLLAEVSATHRPSIAQNEFGTPLISAMFAEAQLIARHSVLCYINGDIILLPDFALAVARLAGWQTFAAVGQRRDIDCDAPIDFGGTDWSVRLLAEVDGRGRLHPPFGIDYFVFRRGAIGPLPPFAIGRPAWDNYLIMHLLGRGVPLVDLSLAAVVVHQNHSHAHIPQAKGKLWEGPEADCNRALADQHSGKLNRRYYSVRNAQWIMLDRHVVPAISPQRLWGRFWASIPDPPYRPARIGLRLLRDPRSLPRIVEKLYRSAFLFPFLKRFQSHPAGFTNIRVAQAREGRHARSASIVPAAGRERDQALQALMAMRNSPFWKMLQLTVELMKKKGGGRPADRRHHDRPQQRGRDEIKEREQ